MSQTLTSLCSVGGRTFDVAGEPDSPGRPQRSSGGGNVLCDANVIALVGSATHTLL